MDFIIFLFFVAIVDSIGLIPSILLVALSPIYLLLYFWLCKKMVTLSSLVRFLCIIAATSLSLAMIVIFFIVENSTRMWG